jgi:hypothetical protein
MHKCKYFKVEELASPLVYSVWGEQSWMFFNPDLLKELDLIRLHWGRGIIINNWHNNGNLSQCGLRSNQDPIVKEKKSLYLSAHCLACGFDLHDVKGNNRGLFNLCYDLIQQGKLKHFKRLENFEKTPTWVHIDSFQSNKIVFN